MIVAIHQPNFMPWLGYFHKMACADVFVYLDNVPYSKGSYTNRVRIKTQRGARWLTVPVVTSGKLGQSISQLLSDEHSDWRRKVSATLEGGYQTCPHWKAYWPRMEPLLASGPANLAELNIGLIEHLAGLLGISTRRVRASTLAAEGKATDLLIAICRELGADTYLSGSGGANYQDEQAFAAAGIKLTYSQFKHPQYPQPFGEFAPGLSVVDLLMNCGPESPAILRAGSGMGVPPMSSTGVSPVADLEKTEEHGQVEDSPGRNARATHGRDGRATHGQDGHATRRCDDPEDGESGR